MAPAPASQLTVIALAGVPMIRPGDDLAAVIEAALAASGVTLADDDVLVLAQKIVSKAEGRYVDLAGVAPSPRAVALAAATEKDARLVELILAESAAVLRHRPGVLVVAHRLGLVLANAGIDTSNLGPAAGAERVLLLPVDPDASCEALRLALARRAGVRLAVVINDSLGRAWRNGTCGVAIGASGIEALVDLRGRPDLAGRALRVSAIGFADEIAATASLVMGQADEGRPIVLLRGLKWRAGGDGARDLIRPAAQDLFR